MIDCVIGTKYLNHLAGVPQRSSMLRIFKTNTTTGWFWNQTTHLSNCHGGHVYWFWQLSIKSFWRGSRAVKLYPGTFIILYISTGWQKMCEGLKGLRRKIWTQTKILSLNIRYFVAILRFVVIYAVFGRLLALVGQKQCFLNKNCTITWHVLHIILN